LPTNNDPKQPSDVLPAVHNHDIVSADVVRQRGELKNETLKIDNYLDILRHVSCVTCYLQDYVLQGFAHRGSNDRDFRRTVEALGPTLVALGRGSEAHKLCAGNLKLEFKMACKLFKEQRRNGQLEEAEETKQRTLSLLENYEDSSDLLECKVHTYLQFGEYSRARELLLASPIELTSLKLKMEVLSNMRELLSKGEIEETLIALESDLRNLKGISSPTLEYEVRELTVALAKLFVDFDNTEDALRIAADRAFGLQPQKFAFIAKLVGRRYFEVGETESGQALVSELKRSYFHIRKDRGIQALYDLPSLADAVAFLSELFNLQQDEPSLCGRAQPSAVMNALKVRTECAVTEDAMAPALLYLDKPDDHWGQKLALAVTVAQAYVRLGLLDAARQVLKDNYIHAESLLADAGSSTSATTDALAILKEVTTEAIRLGEVRIAILLANKVLSELLKNHKEFITFPTLHASYYLGIVSDIFKHLSPIVTGNDNMDASANPLLVDQFETRLSRVSEGFELDWITQVTSLSHFSKEAQRNYLLQGISGLIRSAKEHGEFTFLRKAITTYKLSSKELAFVTGIGVDLSELHVFPQENQKVLDSLHEDSFPYVYFLLKIGYQPEPRLLVERLVNLGMTRQIEEYPKMFAFGVFVQEGNAASLRCLGPVRLTDYPFAQAKLENVHGSIKDDLYYKEIWLAVREHPEWLSLQAEFELGAQHFGYREMLHFTSACDVSRHDTVTGIKKVRDMFELLRAHETVSRKDFVRNILFQVAKDTQSYESGSSYNELYAIADSLSETPEELLEKIKHMHSLQNETALLEKIQAFTGGNALSSWNNLKSYAALYFLVTRKTEALTRIFDLERRGLQKHANYFREIAFHPHSKVNLKKLVIMFEKPRRFLALKDDNAHTELLRVSHDSKKPSNYISIPYLRLTAKRLVSALVTGKLDKLQVFPSVSYLYEFRDPEEHYFSDLEALPLESLARLCINDSWTGLLKKTAKNVFPEIQAIVNENRNVETKARGVQNTLNQISELDSDQTKRIREILISAVRRVCSFEEYPPLYKVTVHRKSDPKAVVAGNDTACCMPFGSGKNTVYMFNLMCAQFTIQLCERTSDGKSLEGRTVSQSILTLNLDAQRPAPQLFQEFHEAQGDLSKVVDESRLASDERYVACDSIEVNDNFVSKPGKIAQLKMLYEDFFSRYLQALPDTFSDGARLIRDRVLVGFHFAGPFGDQLTGVKNSYVPVAPMGWIDNMGNDCRIISPKRHAQLSAQELHSDIPHLPIMAHRGRVTELTYLDSLHVGYIEGRIYGENPETTEHLAAMQNALMAKDIASGPPLSVKYVSERGGMRGYLLAYEGEIGAKQATNLSRYGLQKGARIIYVSDLASLDPNSLSGRKMLLEFLDRVKAYYQQSEQGLPPILMEARESTSRRLLEPKHLDRLAGRLGVKWQRKELGFEQRGKDRFYLNLIFLTSGSVL